MGETTEGTWTALTFYPIWSQDTSTKTAILEGGCKEAALVFTCTLGSAGVSGFAGHGGSKDGTLATSITWRNPGPTDHFQVCDAAGNTAGNAEDQRERHPGLL